MNCRPGDLAIVITSLCGNEGKICTVEQWKGTHAFVMDATYHDAWFVRFPRPVKCSTPGFATYVLIRDAHLRPVFGLPNTSDTDITVKVPA